MGKMIVTYTSNLQTKALHEQSGSVIFTEAPVDNEGTGAGFSPTDLVASALGSCILTIIGISAKKNQFSIDGAKVVVNKIMGTEPRRIIALDLNFDFRGLNLQDKEKRIVEYAIRNCPVANSIHPDIKLKVVIDY